MKKGVTGLIVLVFVAMIMVALMQRNSGTACTKMLTKQDSVVIEQLIHLFYDDKLSCPKDCPDMYVWLSDSETIRLQKHISRISEGDSLITIKGDTILRRINVMDSSLSVTLGEDYHNGCEGSTTIFNLGWRSLTIHSHHHHFCQTHMTPGWYERMWISQNERKKNRK